MASLDHAPAWQLERHEAEKLLGSAPVDPFALLGPHETDDGSVIRAILPGARAVDVVAQADGRVLASMVRGAVDGLFEARIKKRVAYKLRIFWPDAEQETEDPYAFGLLLGEIDIYLFNEGRHFALADVFGAQTVVVDGVPGVRFAVWAPNARRVAVVGDFNSWDPRRHPMRARYPSGIWELFIPHVAVGAL